MRLGGGNTGSMLSVMEVKSEGDKDAEIEQDKANKDHEEGV